jgi:hypothetical protein
MGCPVPTQAAAAAAQGSPPGRSLPCRAGSQQQKHRVRFSAAGGQCEVPAVVSFDGCDMALALTAALQGCSNCNWNQALLQAAKWDAKVLRWQLAPHLLLLQLLCWLAAYAVVSASSRGAAAAAGVVVSSRFCVQRPCRQPHNRRVNRLFLATRVEAYANGCCIMLLMMMMGTTASCKHGTVCWL